jgi:hypothetical protein
MSQGRSVPERGQSGRKGPQKEQVSHLRRNLGAVCLQIGTMKVTDFAEKGIFPHPAKDAQQCAIRIGIDPAVCSIYFKSGNPRRVLIVAQNAPLG